MTHKILAALLLAFALGACGQSGPLYIPGDPSTLEGPQRTEQADEEKDEEDNGSQQ
jgi:predicted small lipoprotein YifL